MMNAGNRALPILREIAEQFADFVHTRVEETLLREAAEYVRYGVVFEPSAVVQTLCGLETHLRRMADNFKEPLKHASDSPRGRASLIGVQI